MSRNGRGTMKMVTRTGSSKSTKRPQSKRARIKAQLEFLRQFQREKEEAWARLSPAQQREELAKWKRAMRLINKTRGYRKVFVE